MSTHEQASGTPAEPIKIDTLIHAKWLIPMTRDTPVLAEHSLAIMGEIIISIEPTHIAKTRFTSRHEYSLESHAVIPGLINAHGHSAMALFRGFADDMPLKPWLEEKIWPAESKWVNDDFVYDGARLAIAEMLLSGTTCFSDMYFFPDQVAKAALEAKIRCQLAAPVLDFPTIWAQNADEYIHKATLLHDEYRNNEYIHTAFGPHASYTVSDKPLQKISMLADELDIPIHIHLHENAQEVEDAIKHKGERPFARLDQLGLLSPRLQCVHMTQLIEAEIDLLVANAVNIVHCPSSNMKLASGICPVQSLLQRDINVCLGSDGAASNNNLDMFTEMRNAALLSGIRNKSTYEKDAGIDGRSESSTTLSARQVLEMATINAAKSMGLDKYIGSLAVNKYADIVAIDLNYINSQPVYDPISALVYSVSSNQVSHVWVGGNLTVDAGKLKSLDTEHLLKTASSWAQKIQQD